MINSPNQPDQDIGRDLKQMSGAEIDTLIALVEQGPLFDGDLPSKSGRDTLLAKRFSSRIAVKGEQGYNAATYAGCEAYCKLFGADTIKEAMELKKDLKAAGMVRSIMELTFNENPIKQTRITRMHYTDLECAALNGGADTMAIWEKLKKDHDFIIDEEPINGQFYTNFSICFLYPKGAEEAHKAVLKNVSRVNIYSFRAESIGDVIRFVRELHRPTREFQYVIEGEAFFPDVVVELKTSASIDDVKNAIRACEDSHVMIQTLRPLTAKENSFERDYDIL